MQISDWLSYQLIYQISSVEIHTEFLYDKKQRVMEDGMNKLRMQEKSLKE